MPDEILDFAKPFYIIRISDKDSGNLKFEWSPNIFMNSELPEDDSVIAPNTFIEDIEVKADFIPPINTGEVKINHNVGFTPNIVIKDKLEIYLGYYLLSDPQSPVYSLTYTGNIDNIRASLNNTIVKASSVVRKITDFRRELTFSRTMTITDIIKKLAIEDAGLEEANNGISETDISKQKGYAISKNQSVYDHLKKLGDLAGFDIYMDPFDKFNAREWSPEEVSSDGDGTHVLPWISDRGDTESNVQGQLMHNVYFGVNVIDAELDIKGKKNSEVEIVTFADTEDEDALTIEPPTGTSSSTNGEDSGRGSSGSTDSTTETTPTKLFLSRVTKEDAEKIANVMMAHNNTALSGNLTIIGGPQIRLGDGIQLFGHIYGRAPFTRISVPGSEHDASYSTVEDEQEEGAGSGEPTTFKIMGVRHIFNDKLGFITKLMVSESTPIEQPEEEEGETPEEGGDEGGEDEEEEGGEEEEEDEDEEEGEKEEEEDEDEREEIEFLKLPGINFNFDSAIVLTRDLGDIKGIIDVINETETKVLIAGHTDRMGTDTYNLNLSLLRAKSVLAICTGNRSTFREILDSGKWKIEDYQMILNDFGFYNGPEDGKERYENNEAISNFQVYYNANLRKPLEVNEVDERTDEVDGQEAPEIAVDGIIGNQTWDAIFRTMVRVIEVKIEETKFGDTRFIGCGEFRPIERPTKDQVRSEINRRVEFLLYPEESFPEISGQPASRDATNAAYNDDLFKFEEITFDTLPPNLPLGQITITDLSWNTDVARRGETLNLTANVENVGDDTEAIIEIYEFDSDGKHDLIKKIDTKVKDGRIEENWDYEYIKDTDEIPTEEESEKGYNPPEYFFTIDIGGRKFGELQESGLLGFKDFIEINLKDINDEPISDQEFTLQLPDGSEINGKVDSDGYARVDDIPPGKVKIKFIKK